MLKEDHHSRAPYDREEITQAPGFTVTGIAASAIRKAGAKRASHWHEMNGGAESMNGSLGPGRIFRAVEGDTGTRLWVAKADVPVT